MNGTDLSLDFAPNGSASWMDYLKKDLDADTEDTGAVVPYDPVSAAANSALKFDEDDLPAFEYSSWDEHQRVRVRVEPPETIAKITDFELAYIDLSDLMKLMEKAGYTPEQVRQTKIKRRKLKNRNSARGSATKKRSQFNTIATTNKQLSDMVSDLRNRNHALSSANGRLQRQTEQARIIAAEAVKERKRYQAEIERLTMMLDGMNDSGSVSPGGSDSEIPFVQ